MATNVDRYRVGPDDEIRDVNLDEEDVRLPDGRRLTEELAEQLATEPPSPVVRTALERRLANLIPGGKSLSGDRSHSPIIQFRVPESLQQRLRECSRREGRSQSALAREALEQYLDAR